MPAELPRPTDAELSILRILWRLGRATVREVHAELEEVSPAGYTTVLKLLQIMTEKGLVQRDETARAHVYVATLSAEETQAQLLRHLLDRAFDGSASLLVQRALSAAPATPEELGQIPAVDSGGGKEGAMKMLFSWLGQPQALQLGWTLAHFVWQGSLLGAAWLWLRHALRARSPEVRYRVACGILVLMAAAPPATWVILRSSPLVAAATSRIAAGAGETPTTFAFLDARSPTGATTSSGATWNGWAGRVEATSNDLMPWFALIWLGGVVAGALRLGAGAGRVASVRQRSAKVEDQRLLACVQKLRARLGLKVPVRLLKSAWVEVPTVIGWLRPAILLPVGSLVGFSPSQLELLLAHELAHIRRRDQWVNLLQVGVETLLFYHPAVWWVSRDIRQEREHCCDDLAVRACGDRLAYVQALASMEELRMLTAGLTLGAGGGSLFGRVRRLLFPERSESDWRCVAGSTLLLLGLVLTAAGATAWLMSPKHYEASARIQVDPPSGSEWDRAPRSVAPSSPAEMEDYLANAMANLQSRSLIESVAVRRVNRKATEPLPKPDDPAISLVVDDLAARLRVRRPIWTSQLELTVSADTPQEAADLANALADEFIEQNLLRHQKVMLELLFFLRSQATAVEMDVAKASEAMQQYRRSCGFVSFGKGESSPAQALAAAQLQYGESLSRCRSAVATVEELERHLREGKSVDTFPPLAADSQLRQVRLDLIRMETELPGLLKGFAEEHPQVQQARARIQATREALERLGRDSIEVLRAQARLARMAEQTQKELVDRWAAEQEKWQDARAAYDALEAKAEASRALYSRVLARMKDVELAQKDKGNNMRVVDQAVAPARPVYSLRSPALVLAGVGLLLGSFGSVVLRRLKAMAEREELAGLPPADA